MRYSECEKCHGVQFRHLNVWWLRSSLPWINTRRIILILRGAQPPKLVILWPWLVSIFRNLFISPVIVASTILNTGKGSIYCSNLGSLSVRRSFNFVLYLILISVTYICKGILLNLVNSLWLILIVVLRAKSLVHLRKLTKRRSQNGLIGVV